jgi:hypothetical protein
MRANLSDIFQNVKTEDPIWQDMEIEYMSPEMLEELLQMGFRGHRWNINEQIFDKLEESLQYAKLKDSARYKIEFLRVAQQDIYFFLYVGCGQHG